MTDTIDKEGAANGAAPADNVDDGTPEFRSGRRDSVSAEIIDPSTMAGAPPCESYEKSDEQKENIQKILKRLFLVKSLDDNQLNDLIDAMKPTPVTANCTVIKQGDEGDFFYVIERGKFEAIKTDKNGTSEVVNTYSDEGYFGELSLMYNEPRAATIKSTTEGFLWAVSRSTFQRLVLGSAYEKRQMYESMLRKVPELEPLNSYELMSVCDALQPKAYEQGDVIFEEGDDGDGMYFVQEGQVEIVKGNRSGSGLEADGGGGGRAQTLSIIEPGGYFGELALMTDGGTRAASAIARTKCCLAYLDRYGFERLLGPCDELLQRRTDSYGTRDDFNQPQPDKEVTKCP